jgi:hypothetical protein
MIRRCLCYGIALLISTLGMATPRATAQQVPLAAHIAQLAASRCGVSDQNATRVVLTCEPGFASPRDQVMIYSRTIDPNWVYPTTASEPLPDMREGFWLFDVGADGTANLVIEFSSGSMGEAIADFYFDLDDSGAINLSPPNADELLRVNERAAMRMIAPEGWWTDGEKTNFNLDIALDGQFRGNFSIPLVYDTPQWRAVTTDGTPEFLIHVRDTDRDGLPDYEWRQADIGLPDESAQRRTEINYNTEDDEGAIQHSIFWRYLSSFIGDYVKPVYGESIPPIEIDWANASLGTISEFVSSRTNAGSFFVYSSNRLDETTLSIADFESPFAFYNLTGITPAMPDLLIRASYTAVESPFFVDGDTNIETTNRHALQEMYYAWRRPIPGESLAQSPVWDYSISLGGRHEYTDETRVGPFNVLMPAYADLPDWVIEKDWDFASMSANEGGGYADSEAIPRWSVLEGTDPLGNLYITGAINDSPFARRFTNIDAGQRSDMAPAIQDQLWLYVDPLDGKLHLQQTAFGMWRLNALGSLTYRNLDGDAYLDQWTYNEGGRVRQELTRAGDFVLLQDRTTVRIARAPMPRSVYESLPPRTGDELLAIDAAVAAADVEFAPNRLNERFAALNVPIWEVTDAALSSLRLTPDGFEAVLQLGADAETSGTLPIELTTELGDLLTLTGAGDQLTLARIDPPRVIIDSINVGFNPETRPLYDRQRIEVRLRNDSLIGVVGVQVRVNARQDATLISLLDTIVELPGRTTTPLGVVWEPSATGEWQIEASVSVTWAEETSILRASEAVSISPESVRTASYFDLWGQVPLAGALQLALLVGGMLLVGCLFLLIYRRINLS